MDETGTEGTITRAGYTVVEQGNPLALDLAIEVPLLARTGLVHIVGGGRRFPAADRADDYRA